MGQANMKIKILFQLNSIGYGGTEKGILTFLQNLDRTKFTPCLFVSHKHNKIKQFLRYLTSYISPKLKNKYNEKYVIPLVRKQQFTDVIGESNIYYGDHKLFIDLVKNYKPNIIHFNRGGWYNFYEKIISKIPKNIICIETCIFGREPSKEYINRLSKFYFLSNWLISKSSWQEDKGDVLYLPTKLPNNNNDLRSELNLQENEFVLGRIARPNNFSEDFFLIDVFKKLPPNCTLIIIAASDELKNSAKGLENILYLEPTIDEALLSKFYNTIDILLHRRLDGETFGLNIAEALIHGKPVISHLSSVDNAQAELLDSNEDGSVGYVSEENSLEQYVNNIKKYINDRALLEKSGNNAKKRALRLFSEQVVTSKLESEYMKLLKAN